MISLEQGCKCMFERVPVYLVHYCSFQFWVNQVLIVRIQEPKFGIRNPFTAEHELVNGERLFLNEAEAELYRDKIENAFLVLLHIKWDILQQEE